MSKVPEFVKDVAGSANAGVGVSATLFGFTLNEVYAAIGIFFLVLQIIRFFRQGGINGSKRSHTQSDS